MDKLTIILIGAAKFLGFAVLFLPIITGMMMDTAQKNYENRLMRFYFVYWPMILLCGTGVALLIATFYLFGKEGWNV